MRQETSRAGATFFKFEPCRESSASAESLGGRPVQYAPTKPHESFRTSGLLQCRHDFFNASFTGVPETVWQGKSGEAAGSNRLQAPFSRSARLLTTSFLAGLSSVLESRSCERA